MKKGLENPIIAADDIEDLIKEIGIFNPSPNSKIRHTNITQDLISYTKDILRLIGDGEIVDQSSLERSQNILRKQYHIQPRKSDLIACYRKLLEQSQIDRNNSFELIVKRKGCRSNSGVVVITVLTSPGKFSCPMDCHYCPDERDESGKRNMPRSYISTEPACRRATRNRFDPVLQFFDRASVLYSIGHTIDKVELLVLGGTWSFYPPDYQESFIRDLYYAANTFHTVREGEELRERYSLRKEQTLNESATVRVIGLTLETRPDCIIGQNKAVNRMYKRLGIQNNPISEIERFRKYNCTRVQIGVQHTNDEILRKINRECTTAQTIKAIRMLKENCFKVDIHLMPDLPGSSPVEDSVMFDRVLTDSDLQADQWKIYPTSVTPFTKIKEWYEKGEYKPYAEEDNGRQLIDLLKYVNTRVHPWIRLNRVIRDIPNQNETTCPVGVIGGNQVTNLRQVVLKELEDEGLKCKCIRCREVKDGIFKWEDVELICREYQSSLGDEYFISAESKDRNTIYGFLRLRFNAKYPCHSTERLDIFNGWRGILPSNSGLIRELHVYGHVIAHDKENKTSLSQHSGIGKALLAKAEKIARMRGCDNLIVISGVGVRSYYRKRGFKLASNDYMTKSLWRPEDMMYWLLMGLFVLFMFFGRIVYSITTSNCTTCDFK